MTRPDGTYPYETLMRHTPNGVGVSHRTVVVVGGKEFVGDPMPLTGEGLTDIADPALTMLIRDINTTALAAAAERDALIKQVQSLTAECDGLTQQVAVKDEEIAKLQTAVNALGTTEQGVALAKQIEIERLEKQKSDAETALAALKTKKG